MVNKVKSYKKIWWSSKQCANSTRSNFFFNFFYILHIIANNFTFFNKILCQITKFHHIFPHKLSSSGFLQWFPLRTNDQIMYRYVFKEIKLCFQRGHFPFYTYLFIFHDLNIDRLFKILKKKRRSWEKHWKKSTRFAGCETRCGWRPGLPVTRRTFAELPTWKCSPVPRKPFRYGWDAMARSRQSYAAVFPPIPTILQSRFVFF